MSDAASGPRKILVIKLRAIGDVLLSSSVLASLRSAYPWAQIDFLTEKFCRDVIEGNAIVNELLVFDPKKQTGVSLIRQVRKRSYDLVFDLFGNPRSAIVTLLSGAVNRVGFRFSWRARCYTTVVDPRGGDVHNIQFNLDALRAVGIPIVEPIPRFHLSPDGERVAESFWDAQSFSNHPVIALNQGGGWQSKRWRVEGFARLGDYVVRHHGAKVIIIWGPGEHDDAENIRQHMSEPAVLIPHSSIKELGSILRRCALLVTNDSGPMHIAAALGTPVVAIFGPTDPDLQGPVGTRSEVVQNNRIVCLGCNFTTCPIGNPCMTELTVDDVALAVDRVLHSEGVSLTHSCVG